ncbi:MAG: extracellular solute-binding protein [bacterium]|nr:extracellular solute-binding protein [bacterium]
MKIYRWMMICFMMLMIVGLAACKTTSGDVLKIALDIEDEGRYDTLFQRFFDETGIRIEATFGIDPSKCIGTSCEPDIMKTSTVVIDSMQGTLLDLTDFIAQDDDVDPSHYVDALMEALTIDGKIYALPTSINTSLLYYNKRLFDESAQQIRDALQLSLEESVYPSSTWTYDDYVLAGVALSKFTVLPNMTRSYTQFGAETQLIWWGEWLVYLQQMGGSFYQANSQNRICALDTAIALEATTFYVKKSMGNASEKFAPNAIEAASAFSFLNGNVAMIFGGHMGDWYSYDVLGLDWDIQVLPVPANQPNAVGGEISADAFGISIRSNKRAQAFQFLKMWTGVAGATEMVKYGKIGALKNMQTIIHDLPIEEQPRININALFQAIDRATTLPREKDFPKVMREMVMTELYKLMFTGRGAETNIQLVLNRIKHNVDQYYIGLYKNN